jgi:3-oxoacyl-[acyl-carrier-protein] synthase-3
MSVPEKVLTNKDLEKMVDTSDQWIVSRTGIRERRIAADDQSTASLAVDAAIRAMEKARIRPRDVELIIVATSSPEHLFPATASLVQDRLGAFNAGGFDLSAACSGFIYALNMASQSISSGSIKCALVIGSETLSRLVDWNDRNTCVLFGDGAGAFVLQASEQPGGLLSAVMRSDGSGGDLLSIPAGGSKVPASVDSVIEGQHYIKMNGREVFRFATRVMTMATQEAVCKANLTMDDIQLIIPHQANKRIIELSMKGLDIPLDRCVVNIGRYGNTSTASIPIATCDAIADNRLKPGDNVVFVGFGGGLTWGAAVANWSGPLPGEKKPWPGYYRPYAKSRSLVRKSYRWVESILWGRRNNGS